MSVAERLSFLKSFVTHPRQVGAVLPTSRRAVRDMLDMASVGTADIVVELGAGTGVHTDGIVARLAPGARLLTFEIDQDLAGALDARIDDPRVSVLAESAENVRERLEGSKADIVVSALPYSSLPAPVRTGVLDAVEDVLAPGGVFLVLQYSPLIESELRRRYRVVRRRLSVLNVPPAVLFACSEPTAGQPSA